MTDAGRFTQTLPCDPGEPCGPDGRIVVRAPDGVHFCPHPTEPAGLCAVYSSGARRFGYAVASGDLRLTTAPVPPAPRGVATAGPALRSASARHRQGLRVGRRLFARSSP